MKLVKTIAVCEKTAGLRSGNSSDLDLVPVEIFQFSEMHYEICFLDTFEGTTYGLV